MTGLGQVGALGRLGAPALARGGWWLSGSALELDFANNRTYNSTGNVVSTPASTLTVVRASAGSYFDSAGVLRQAANNALRLDHDPVTLAPLGVLVEEQRTNLLTYSEQFDNATGWPTKTNLTVSANAVTAPNGAQEADTITDDTTNGTHRIFRGSVTLTAAAHTLSIYAKAGTATWFQILAFDGTTTFYANFDLSAGALGTVAGSGATGSIQSVGNGWYRCSLTFTAAATAGGNVQIHVLDSNTVTTPVSYVGTGKTHHIWGAQLEAGAFATSYIPTGASQVTRAADQVSILTSAFAYGASHTLLTTADIHVKSSNVLAQLDDGTLTNRMTCWADSGPNPHAAVRTANVAQAAVTIGSVSLNTEFNIAFVFAENDVTGAVDGALAASPDTSCNLPTTTTLRVGSRVSDGYLNGHIKRLTYFPTRKSDSELQALSA